MNIGGLAWNGESVRKDGYIDEVIPGVYPTRAGKILPKQGEFLRNAVLFKFLTRG